VSGRGPGVIPGCRWALTAATLMALAVACPLLAADVSGSWDISYWTAHTRQTIVLELVQDGSRLSGTATLRVADTDSMIDATVQGTASRSGDFHFLLVDADRLQSRSQEFVGSWYRNEMSGLTSGSFGEAIFAGVRRRVPDQRRPAIAGSARDAKRLHRSKERAQTER